MKNFVTDCLDHQDIMLISIVWIGYLLNPKYEEHEVLIQQKCTPEVSEAVDYYPQFELTCLGEAICLNEYATRIARGHHTNVLHIDIADESQELEDEHVQQMEIA